MEGFYILYDDVYDMMWELKSELDNAISKTENLKNNCMAFILLAEMEGKTAKAITDCLREVHIPMLDALQTIAQSMLDSIIVYKTGYNRIDESTDFAISQEHISGMRKQLAKNCMDMDTIAETVEDLLKSVSELITIEDKPNIENVMSVHESIDTDIGDFLQAVETRENDTVKTLEDTSEMLIDAFQVCVNNVKTKMPDVKSYVPGKFNESIDVNNLSDKVTSVKIEREKNREKYEASWAVEIEEKLKREQKEEADRKAFEKTFTGVTLIIGGVAAIAASGGAATPIVFTIANVGGGASIVYGTAEMSEGSNISSNARQGKFDKKAENWLRDNIFGGNEQLYNISLYAVSLSTNSITGALGAGAKGTTDLAKMAIGLAAGDVAGTMTSMKVYELTESQMASLLVGMITSGGVSFGVTKLGKVSNVNLADEAGEIRIGESGSKSSKGGSSTVQKVFTDSPFDEAGNLKPNIKYQTGEFNYNYETDANGRISNWNTDNLQLTERDARLNYNSDTPGKFEGDHAGHLAGDRFGGSPELDNIVSQSQNVNLSQYKKIENQWAKAIKEGKEVTVNVDIKYDGDGLRPIEFNVEYTIDGDFFSQSILN